MSALVLGEIVVAAVQNILFALGVGILACGLLLPAGGAPPGEATPGGSRRDGDALLRWRPRAFGAVAIAAIIHLCLQTLLMSGGAFADAVAMLPVVLRQSHFGAAWTLGFAGTLIAAASGRRPRGAPAVFAALGALGYLVAKAAASHAADAGDGTLREAVHAVHLGATAVWAGSVMVAALVLLPRRAGTSADAAARRAVFCSRLSDLATYALATVALTGLYDVVRTTAASGVPLFDTAYGRVLAVKLACVALAVGLGGYNRLTYLPRLGSDDASRARRRFGRLLGMEAVAMLFILAIAALLGHLAPSGND
ncbi:CopD family protein [Robbsia sp. Bb-Pol-6]|uniref:CopD family protein n=1 Tax=Robbsia betulipollinis TaxID=2981849 RepID=A0ABT3ZJ55_9BURK|nr:CopD family protein [Robbsia betulipollinis]MCY0386563.1 CopD family protein [Robbsia betulipollinis]